MTCGKVQIINIRTVNFYRPDSFSVLADSCEKVPNNSWKREDKSRHKANLIQMFI